MKLKDVMTDDLKSVDRNTLVDEAAELMRECDIGALPVCEGAGIVGIITDRDIVLRSVSADSPPSGVTCGDIMSSAIISGSPDMDVREAAKIMSANQIRRLPVVESGKLVGMVSLGDIAVEPKMVNEAGEALNDISKPDKRRQ